MKTDELQPEYIIQNEVDDALEMLGKGYENAAEIHPPKTIHAIKDKGLEEYKVWGWVKISANFINHIKKLKGAKLAIWQVIALSIDENGECKLSIQEIADLSGYSYSETHQSLKELDEMEYLSTDKKKGRKSMFSPSFAARGFNSPDDNPSRKTRGQDKQPLQSTGDDPSSPSIENAHSSIKELKELIPVSWKLQHGEEVTQQDLDSLRFREEAPKTFEKALGFGSLPWDSSKEWRALQKFITDIYIRDRWAFGNFNLWRATGDGKYKAMSNKQIRMNPQMFMDTGWAEFENSQVKKTDETRLTYAPIPERIKTPKPAGLVPNIKRHEL